MLEIKQFEPPIPTVDDLVATGQAVIITSPVIRAGIARLIRQLQEVAELEAELATVQFDRTDAFLLGYADLGRIGRTRGNASTVPQTGWDRERLLAAPALPNLTNMKILILTFLREELDVVIVSADSLLARLEEGIEPG